MYLQAVLLVSTLCASIQPIVGMQRGMHVGRKSASDQKYSWVVAVSKSGKVLCGGSAINPRTVLTSAECIYNEIAKQLTVRAGSSKKSVGGQLIPVSEAVYPTTYDDDKWSSNIAILRLARDIDWKLNIKPVRIALGEETVQTGSRAEVCGWGATGQGKSEFLRCAEVKIAEEDICHKWYSNEVLDENIVCAIFTQANNAQCYGDIGGPLVAKNMLVGIVTWASAGQCTRPDEPGIYTKVAPFIGWINSYLNMFNERI